MKTGFSGFPETRWINHRDMQLLNEFTFTDNAGKLWKVPSGSFLNGATIPRALWSRIGSPFVGKYRRASVVHDYFVGEGPNQNVTKKQRKLADKMFYEACIHDGCSKNFAGILYLGVCLGTWGGTRKKLFKKKLRMNADEEFMESPEDKLMQAKFDFLALEMDHNINDLDFDHLHSKIEASLKV